MLNIHRKQRSMKSFEKLLMIYRLHQLGVVYIDTYFLLFDSFASTFSDIFQSHSNKASGTYSINNKKSIYQLVNYLFVR